MLNYCKFKIGKIDTYVRPPKSVINVLSWYKHGHFDKIGPGYMQAIIAYQDLIEEAIKIDGRKDKKGVKRMKEKEIEKKIKNRKNEQAFNNAKEKFKNWLDIILYNELMISPKNKTYTMHIVTYKNYKLSKLPGYLPKYISEVLDEPKYSKILTKYYHKQGRLVRLGTTIKHLKDFFSFIKGDDLLDSAILTRNATFKNSIDNLYEMEKTKETGEPEQEIEKPKSMISDYIELEDCSEKPNIQSNECSTPDRTIIDSFLSELKKLGVKEFIIKF